MKNHLIAFSGRVLSLALVAAVSLVLPGQEKVFERVEVVRQEILVRVFADSRLVPGLKAEDFTLYEDGKKVEINYCRELRRSLVQPESTTGASAAAVRRPRLFLFMLWFNEESREWPKAWEYFLTKIYRPGDRIILCDDEQVIEVSSPEKEQEKLTAFFARMVEGLKQKKNNKVRLVNELEKAVVDFYNSLIFNPFGYQAAHPTNDGNLPPGLEVDTEKGIVDQFKQQYKGIVDEYRLTRLKEYPRLLERLAGALKSVDAEKWVLVFLQNERLPLLDREGRLIKEARMKQTTSNELQHVMDEIDKQLQLEPGITSYVRDLQPLFIGANATFHLFLSDAEGERTPNEQMRWKSVFSSWEGTFRQISADTGGRVADSTLLGEALQKAAASEDIYYVLTYPPAAGAEKRRELRVEMNRPGLKAVYSRKLALGELFPLKIQGLNWQDGILKIVLSDFQRMYGEAGLTGRLRISVRAEMKGRVPLVAEKEIMPAEPAVDLGMALNFPAPGRYLVKVDAEDLLSNNKVHAEKEIEILSPQPREAVAVSAEAALPADLAAVLDLAAGYCRRLKEGAFRFFCFEKIEEKFLERNPLKQQVETIERRWEYDYQITGAGGEINEQRRLIREGTRKMDKENASLATRFSSHYSVFLPVTLLATENRKRYTYRLLEREKVKSQRCAVVEVLPRGPGSGAIAQGKVWIDEQDGSVLKIEMSPRGVAGVEALEKAAKNLLARLLLEVTHFYLVKQNDLRFPSMTTFREAYVFEKTVSSQKSEVPFSNSEGKNPTSGSTVVYIPKLEQGRREVEFYRLRQDYEKYRFFEVESHEEIKEPRLY